MGYVYLICDSDSDTYKIGVTKNSPDKRLKQLKTGNSNDLFLLKTFETDYYKHIEKILHSRYKHLCVNLEWFSLPIDVIQNFDNICSEIETTHIFLLEHNQFYKHKF